MAPGVGKTYQMLEEGHEERDAGRDVVVGYLETHGRMETLAEAEGLEILPRRRVEYAGTALEEMDLPAILRRRPELCLIDELAHVNAPGTEHARGYEDVEAVLDAGIDVCSTVNVQHVESLAGQIAALTGVQPRHLVPDRVLDEADNVVLVDITPKLLIERLEAGKIYPRDSAIVARSGFFRPDRLQTLREVSLHEMTQEVERGQPTTPSARLHLQTRPSPSRDRVPALATPDPWIRPTVDHAYRAVQRLHAPLDVLWVPARGVTADPDDENVATLERLVAAIGGTLLIRREHDLLTTAAAVATERGTTYLVLGRPLHRNRLGRLAHRRLPLQLMRAIPGVDVQIVAPIGRSPTD